MRDRAVNDSLPPLPTDAMSKFQQTPPGGCDPGAPVRDTTWRIATGDPCCSSCRRLMEVVDGVWVHLAVPSESTTP